MGTDMQDPAAEALDALVQQFSSRSAFVRELIQNSLDAGAGCIEVRITAEAAQLQVEVIDDGDGMSREIIETCLLTLFRSSKERDLTKIGKFGIGFVSLFALQPEAVVVDTGRDGLHHRVVFDTARRYTLAAVAEPFEGTAVHIWVPAQGAAQQELAEEIRQALHYWCRYAQAEVWIEATGARWGWPAERVEHDFTVQAPVQVQVVEDGLRAVLGFTTDDPPYVGYYNHGLTLLEAREAVVPGVTFRVEAQVLEHTLTRDNVIRDRNHQAVVRRLTALARERLGPALLAALTEAIAAQDWPRHALLLPLCALPLVALPDDLPCLRTADGGLTTIGALRPGLLRRMLGNELLSASGPSPLVTALVASGRIVLLGPPAPELALALALGLGTPMDVHDKWILPEVLPDHPLVTAVGEGTGSLPAWRRCLAARFTDRGKAIAGALVTHQSAPGALEERTLDAPAPPSATLLINVDHPAFVRLAALPVPLAAPLLRHAVRRGLSIPGPFRDEERSHLLAQA